VAARPSDHPSIQRGGTKSRTSKVAAQESQNGETGGASFVLKVQRPALDASSHASSRNCGWLEAGWDDPSRGISVLESRPEPEEQIESRVARFADSAARPAAFQRWKSVRDEWAKNEKPARACMKIFERFTRCTAASIARPNASSLSWETAF